MHQHERGDGPKAVGSKSGPARQAWAHQPTRGRIQLAAAVTVALAGVALGSVALATGGRPTVLLASQSGALKPGATVTVTGSGTVTGRPDTLSFQIGVHSTASSAAAALRENDALVARLEATLEARGVPASGLQTSQLDIYANENSRQVITGFSVDDSLSVTTHDVSSAGSVLDAAAEKVGNGVQLNSIDFSISNQSGLLATARAAAMANARTEASQVAAGAGLTLGGIVRVTDQENASPQPIFGGLASAASTSGRAVPLEVGTQPVNVQVSVVYSLQG